MLRPLLALALFAAPALAQDRADAIVIVADDGGLDPSAGRAIQAIATTELRKRGIVVAEDQRTTHARPAGAWAAQLAAELGARRIFAVRIGGRLGVRVPLTIEELAPASMATVYSASLTASTLEECDMVTARLVDAVVDRRSAETNATMRTVTNDEARPFQKKPGERFWSVSLPVALFNARSGDSPVGIAVSYGYEAEFFRLGASVGAYGRGDDGTAFSVLEGYWIPFDGEISPYVGGGLGYMVASSRGGMGSVVEAGVEALRLHGVRAMAGMMATVPFFDATGVANSGNPRGRTFYPAAFARLSF